MKKRIKRLLRLAMWLTIVIFAIRAAISWKEIQSGVNAYIVFGYAGEAIGISAIIMVCYERWLWRYDPFLKVPYIAGKYNGVIKSNYDKGDRKAQIQIKQSLLTVEVTLKTKESGSKSISGSVEEILGEPELIYTYLNESKARIRERSSIHYGTATFTIENKKQLTGKYFTDRETTGDLYFVKKE